MATDYNFDNRLLGMSLKISDENYIDGMLKINGIYYVIGQKLNIGDMIKINHVIGNKLSITTAEPTHLNTKKEIDSHDDNYC